MQSHFLGLHKTFVSNENLHKATIIMNVGSPPILSAANSTIRSSATSLPSPRQFMAPELPCHQAMTGHTHDLVSRLLELRFLQERLVAAPPKRNE